MSKHKAPKYIRDRRAEQPPLPPKPRGRWWKLPLEIFAGVSAVLGIFGFLLSVLPKLSLEVSGSLRPLDPMGTVFYLSNDGLVSIYDISVACQPNIEVSNGPTMKTSGSGKIYFPNHTAKVLSPGKKFTVPCGTYILLPDGAQQARMNVLVSYRPPFVWWHKEDRFPLTAEKTINGEWLWKNDAE